MNVNRYGRDIQQKISRLLEIPDDIVFDLPKITLIGDVQLYIENHRGIIEYSPRSVRIAVTLGELEIMGESLIIRNISKEEIYLDGRIHSFRFNR